jgi:hypothetical protein
MTPLLAARFGAPNDQKRNWSALGIESRLKGTIDRIGEGQRTMDVGDWLRSLGLGQYEAAFRENAIDDRVPTALLVVHHLMARRSFGPQCLQWAITTRVPTCSPPIGKRCY